MAVAEAYISASGSGLKTTGLCSQATATADGTNYNFVDNATDKNPRLQRKIVIANPSTNKLYFALNTPGALLAAAAHGLVPGGQVLTLETGDGIYCVTCLADTGAITPGITGIEA